MIPMTEKALFSIKAVAQQTGLTPYVIRAWERRYKAVVPRRTRTNRRLYSEADIAKLLLLRRAKERGYSIGQIAQLPVEKLLALLNEPSLGTKVQELPSDSDWETHLQACFLAVERFDAEGLKQALAHAGVTLGWPVLIERVLFPLMHKIGECWRNGSLRIGQEHLASAVIRAFLGNLEMAPAPSTTAPILIVTTPVGQLHEIGALAAAAIATAEGWRVTYLGPNLPAEEIANAAHHCRARAVALSIVYPPDDPHLPWELEKLRRYLPAHVPILVGGRSAHAYVATLERIGAILVSDWASFRTLLESLRLNPVP